MAKFETHFQGELNELLLRLHNDITSGSVSASYEDGSDIHTGDVSVAVRVYERYSMAGGNRVSLSITVVAENDDIHLTAISSGGSQAMFFKINTWGEETFLDQCKMSVERYIAASRY